MKEKPKVTKVNNDESGDKKYRLVIPLYKGGKGTHLLRWMDKYVRKLLPSQRQR